MQTVISDTPRWKASPRCFIPGNDLNLKLLGLALEELPRPLRRSQLARRDYVPEPPAVLTKPKRNWLKGLLRLVRPVLVLIVVALGIFTWKMYNQWFDAHFAYGTEKTPAYLYHGTVIGNGVPEPLYERLPDGRTVMVNYKGHLPSKDQLPGVATSQLGDMWYVVQDNNCWVLAPLSTTNPTLTWIDP